MALFLQSGLMVGTGSFEIEKRIDQVFREFFQDQLGSQRVVSHLFDELSPEDLVLDEPGPYCAGANGDLHRRILMHGREKTALPVPLSFTLRQAVGALTLQHGGIEP